MYFQVSLFVISRIIVQYVISLSYKWDSCLFSFGWYTFCYLGLTNSYTFWSFDNQIRTVMESALDRDGDISLADYNCVRRGTYYSLCDSNCRMEFWSWHVSLSPYSSLLSIESRFPLLLFEIKKKRKKEKEKKKNVIYS